MLFVGLSVIAGIALLILIVWVLHRYQQKENEESVDRRVPLPPIELRESNDEELTGPEDILGLAPTDKAEPTLTPVVTPTTVEKDFASPAQASDQWLELSRTQQASGDYTGALASCHAALPQMGAFRQSCLVLRAQIRDQKKAKKEISPSLEQLYQLVALADFFHGKTENSKPLSVSASKRVAFESFVALESPYADLGYEHLNLLTKTDIKWLTQTWGEPKQHRHMRELHQNRWDTLQDSLK